MSAERPHRRPRPLVFTNRDFGRLWIGQVLNQAGRRVFELAMVWWALTLSSEGGGLRIGGLLLFSALPALLLFEVVGRVVDRSKARTLLAGTDALAAVGLLVVSTLLLRESMPLWGIYVACGFIATLQAFVNPALSRALPDLVHSDDIERAVTFQTSTQPIASFMGAAAGAALIGAVGAAGVAAITAAAFLVSMVLNLTIRFPARTIASTASEADGKSWRVVTRHPVIFRLLLASAAINFFSVPTLVVLPLFVRSVYAADATLLGLLEGALWLGLVCGAFIAPRVPLRAEIGRVGAVCLAGLGVGLGLPGFYATEAFHGAALLLAGAFLGFSNVKFVAHFHQVVADEEKGRFFAVLQALISFTFPVAYLVFGLLGETLSPQWLSIIQGIGIIAVAMTLGSLHLRSAFSLRQTAPGASR